jgi:hypothetical protein
MFLEANLFIGITFFALGYAVGRLDFIINFLKNGNEHLNPGKSTNFLNSSSTKEAKNKKVSIDSSTFVTEVETENFQKSFNEIGNKSAKQDNIDLSVSKLSQLKKK